MFSAMHPDKKWSKTGVRIFIASVVTAFVLIILHGFLWGPHMALEYHQSPSFGVIDVWTIELRNLAEQIAIAAAILIVGAKFFETRTILSIGFNRADASRMVCKGPDEDNIVWIGHRYNTQLEARAVAEALEWRLKNDAQGA